MFANKCDRCGAFYVPTDDMNVYVITKRGVPFSIQLDLCPKCYDNLLTFIAHPCEEESGVE